MADANLTEAQALAKAVGQDDRDWINSLYDLFATADLEVAPKYLNYYWTNLTIDTYPTAELDLTTKTGGSLNGFTIGGAGNIRAIVPQDGLYEVTAIVGAEVPDSYQPWLYVDKNGVEVASDTFYQQLGTTGAAGGSLYVQFIQNADVGDYYTIHVDEQGTWLSWLAHKVIFTIVRLGPKTA